MPSLCPSVVCVPARQCVTGGRQRGTRLVVRVALLDGSRWWSKSVRPPMLGAAACSPGVGTSAAEFWRACSDGDEFLPSITSSSGGGIADPFLRARHSSTVHPFCASAIPQPLSSSRPFQPAVLPALGFLPHLALEPLNPGLATWAAAAQALWGLLLQPVQPLSLFLCCRVAPSPGPCSPRSHQQDREGVRNSAPLQVPVPGSGWSMVGCCKQDVSRINVEAEFRAGS